MKQPAVPFVGHLPATAKPKKFDIIAAQKIIADISSGVYRSPAAAIKELISNAYDADATQVQITTDVPAFRTLTVNDNGTGMDINKFLDVMSHIGGSRKH
jgi:DNA mismatch repair ATPase MutL